MTAARRILVMNLAWTLTLGAARAAAQDSVPAREDYAPTAALLTRLIDHEMTDKDLPAVSVVLVDGGEIVWARGFGQARPRDSVPATARTVFRVGSVSKLFTDIALMRLVERGRLDLDAPVTRYLPDFHPANPFGGAITLRQLMTHHSGLVRESPAGSYFDSTAPPLSAIVASLNRTTLAFRPGTRSGPVSGSSRSCCSPWRGSRGARRPRPMPSASAYSPRRARSPSRRHRGS